MAGGAVLVSQADSPAPGPADLIAAVLLLTAAHAALTHEILNNPTISRPFLNEDKKESSPPSNPEPDAGNFSDKIGKIATALGVTEKQETDAINKVKRNLKAGGKTRNPDFEVDLRYGRSVSQSSWGWKGRFYW